MNGARVGNKNFSSRDVRRYMRRYLDNISLSTFRHQSDTLKKLDQALKDTEYYHHEAETLRSRYNNVIVEKQRLEKENNSMRLFMEEERKEMAEMRRQQQVGKN